MTISKENRQDDDEWKEIISRRIRRVEITIFMLVASFIVSLPEKILSYHQNPTPTKTTRKIEDEVTFASLRGHPDVMTFNTHNETSDRNKIKKTSGKQFSRKLDPVIISYQKSRTRSNQTALISPGHFYRLRTSLECDNGTRFKKRCDRSCKFGSYVGKTHDALKIYEFFCREY